MPRKPVLPYPLKMRHGKFDVTFTNFQNLGLRKGFKCRLITGTAVSISTGVAYQINAIVGYKAYRKPKKIDFVFHGFLALGASMRPDEIGEWIILIQHYLCSKIGPGYRGPRKGTLFTMFEDTTGKIMAHSWNLVSIPSARKGKSRSSKAVAKLTFLSPSSIKPSMLNVFQNVGLPHLPKVDL